MPLHRAYLFVVEIDLLMGKLCGVKELMNRMRVSNLVKIHIKYNYFLI
jgi:hypothetical protein